MDDSRHEKYRKHSQDGNLDSEGPEAYETRELRPQKFRKLCARFGPLCSCGLRRPHSSTASDCAISDLEGDADVSDTTGYDIEIEAAAPGGLKYSDAHCHLDYLLRNMKLDGGYEWVYKNRICNWWQSGQMCPYGDWCHYAHGPSDFRGRCPFELQDIEAFTQTYKFLADNSEAHSGFVLDAMITNCCELESLTDTLFLIGRAELEFRGVVYCTFGCHPSNYRIYDDDMERQLIRAFESCGARAVAWGECGLDYCKEDSRMGIEKQKMIDCFARQAHLAVKRGLPLVVHSRGADADTLDVLRQLPRNHKVHLHGFRGEVATMQELLAMMPNSIIGMPGGIWRDPPWEEDAKIVRHCPLDRLVLETDAPFVCYEPKLIPRIAGMVAKIKGGGLCASEVLEKSTATCRAFYGLPEINSCRSMHDLEKASAGTSTACTTIAEPGDNANKGDWIHSGGSGGGWVSRESEKQQEPAWTNPSVMPSARPKPPPATMGLVTDVKRAKNQPMAYVTLASAEFVDLLSNSTVKDPPFMWPPIKHYENADQLVLRWDVNKPIDKDDIPGHIEQVLQGLLGQAQQPSTSSSALAE